ncbi:unknown protein [Seminavis robusta]|uniref:Uncharacterized protein n=1 Tax=Seminavis robusta TaxID=568900 RepID=A0A9N8DEY6_9STRA|nr:unknown protein [Seminavis robusta]|eukprot:Sro57_g033340.1 n/a (163) ;mRNA; f:74002-74490
MAEAKKNGPSPPPVPTAGATMSHLDTTTIDNMMTTPIENAANNTINNTTISEAKQSKDVDFKETLAAISARGDELLKTAKAIAARKKQKAIAAKKEAKQLEDVRFKETMEAISARGDELLKTAKAIAARKKQKAVAAKKQEQLKDVRLRRRWKRSLLVVTSC